MTPNPASIRGVTAIRLLEWILVTAVVLLLLLDFNQHMRMLQGNTERVTVQTTLGALRTALVIDYLQHSAAAGKKPASAQQHNPFELLERPPDNYLGPMSAQQAASAAPGHWMFDPDCVCVGYTPDHPQAFESPSGSPMLWYTVHGDGGPLQLSALEAYRWQGQSLE